MKKNVSSILVLIFVLALAGSFTGCENLKPSNLEANYNLSKANGFYTDEKYLKAAEAYEKALELNPKLEFIYLYVGTSYSSLFRPGKQGGRDDEFAKKGIEWLIKAKAFDPTNDKVIIALGDLYDKMNNFEEAEKCYLEILERNASDPKSYYTLANFYAKNAKFDQADAMYKKRIELNPEDPEGYHFYVGFLGDQRRFKEAVDNHENRLYAILDSSIVLTKREITKLEEDAVNIKKITDYIDIVNKNTKVDPQEKKRLVEESQQKLEGKLSLEDTNKKIEEMKLQIEEKTKQAEATIDGFDETKKQTIAEAYYSIGNVCWNWSYQSNEEMMSPAERAPIIDKGIAALEMAIKIAPDYANPYSYMGLLWRERIKVDGTKRDEYVKKNELYNKKFISIYKKAQRSEAFSKELDDIGKEEETK